MTLYKWSQIANNDATADSTINWAEGQAPSSINDSARAMMAATAKYRDDIAGAIVTAGTSTAYTFSSFQQFDTLAHLNGMVIAFTPHVTNAGTCTINTDSLGNKPLRSALNTELPAGTLIQGTPYEALYNNTDGAFYLKGLFGNPYGIPIGGSIEFWLPTAPNSSFVFPFGQAISRTTYAALFALMGSTYGSGDGSTTFNLPDLRGRVTGCPDNMGGSDAARLSGSSITSVRTSLGGAGGEGTHTLAASEIPSITSTGIATVNVNSPNNVVTANGGSVTQSLSGGGSSVTTWALGTAASPGTVTSSGSGSVTATSSNTGGGAHNVVQPMILCNRIMRIT